MSLERAGMLSDLIRKATYLDVGRQRVEIRQSRRKAAIHEHHPASCSRDMKLLKIGRSNAMGRRLCQPERTVGNGAHVGETPIFVSGRGKTCFAEARKRIFAYGTQPRWMPGGALLELGE